MISYDCLHLWSKPSNRLSRSARTACCRVFGLKQFSLVRFVQLYPYIYMCVCVSTHETYDSRTILTWCWLWCNDSGLQASSCACCSLVWIRLFPVEAQDIFMVKIVWFLDILKLMGPGNAAMSEMGICFQLHEVLGLDVKDTSNSRLVGCEEVAWRC